MAGAHCASVKLLTSLANTTTVIPNLLKPLLSSSTSTRRSPKKLTGRKNHLRPKNLKTLTKPFTIEPAIPVVYPPEQDVVYKYEHPVSEIEGIAPPVEEVEEIRVSETVGVAGEYSGVFRKFSVRSLLKIGLGFVAVFMLRTICTAWIVGKEDSDEKNKNMNGLNRYVNGEKGRNILVDRNMLYLDKTYENKLNEIRQMAREAREIEGRGLKNGEEEDESGNANGRIGVEKEIGARLAKVENRLKSRGNLPASCGNLVHESKDDESEKAEDKTLIFNKNSNFRRPSTSLRSNVEGFSSSEGCGMNEKKKSGLENVSGMVEAGKSGSKSISANSNYLQNDKENLEKMPAEVGVGDSNMRFGTVQGTSPGRPVEVVKSTKSKNMEMQNLQNFMQESQKTPMKPNKDDKLGGNGSSEHQVLEEKPSANVTGFNKSDMTSNLWWSKLPYVLAILMRRGLEHGVGGLYTLRIPSEVQDLTEASYTIAFEDRGDAKNYCYLLELFFEDLGDFDVDVVPLSVKEQLDAVKSGIKKVIVVKKGQLKFYAGQPFEDVEKALRALVEENHSFSTTNVT